MLREWRIVFWILAVLLFLKAFVFMIWGSGKIQPWNTPAKKDLTENPGTKDVDGGKIAHSYC